MNIVRDCIAFFIALLTVSSLNAQDFAKSRFRQGLELNTSVSGANVKGDVYNFPIAIALNESALVWVKMDVSGNKSGLPH